MTFKPGDKVTIPASDRVYTVVSVFTTLVRIEQENGLQQSVPMSAVHLIEEASTK